jgi:hypothetical protein
MATRGAGRALRVEGLGTVEEGAPADLLVFGEDPIHAHSLGSLELVIADGRPYEIDDLRAVLAMQDRYFTSAVYSRASRLAARAITRALSHE